EPMLPAQFVFLDELPLTGNGKVDRRALAALDRTLERQEPAVPPRNEAERTLVAIWSEVLGRPEVAEIGITDDFLDLGGHSLAAVRVMSRIENAFGVRLPLATLFAAPTIEQLARRLTGRPEAEASASLVSLRAGERQPGLFLVHPVGGSVYCYAALSQAWEAGRPVYAFQATAADGGSLEELAARYVGEMLAVQPAGPYLLGGWSLGGIVAFEMARQLVDAGREVGLLAMLDSAPPADPAAREELDDRALLAGLAADLAGLASVEGLGLPAGIFDGDLDAGLRSLLALGRHTGALPNDMDLPRLRERFAIFKSNLDRARRYLPGPYRGALTFFRAQSSITVESDLTSGWGALAETTEAHLLATDHYALLRPPFVAGLAARLLRSLP
ncbi:MAG TPA: thioesterase domain-containing protein, partial [Thermoanaerobaculia bacterium]|nr:thioesterase domain-containing protein [Thermoanaerobaculia bacterium]